MAQLFRALEPARSNLWSSSAFGAGLYRPISSEDGVRYRWFGGGFTPWNVRVLEPRGLTQSGALSSGACVDVSVCEDFYFGS